MLSACCMSAVHSLLMLLSVLTVAQLALCEAVAVYGPVPGLSPSPHYSVQVRPVGDQDWLSPFTLLTECTREKFCDVTGGFFSHLGNWSNSYVNFEMEEGLEVEVKITKLWGDPVSKAVVRPVTAALSVEVLEGEVRVVINKPGLFTVDINGQMDDQDTGKLPNNRGVYAGPPIHTVTIFANPYIDKPSLEDPGVHPVSPGEEAPSEGPWHTLYFLPGLHDIGLSFRLHANRSYYIPGDAVVYGTMNTNKDWWDGNDIHIFGHGTISGDKLPHPGEADEEPEHRATYDPVWIESNVQLYCWNISQ